MTESNAFCGFLIKSTNLSLTSTKEIHHRKMNIEGIFPRFLLVIATGCCLAEGISSTELKQMSEIVKKLEEKIDNQETNIEKLKANVEKQEETIKNQDAVIKELHRDVSELGTRNIELLERMETRSNRTEEELKPIRDTVLLSAPGDKALRDLPYIMMCAYKGSSRDTGIIPYDKLTLDYNNCDRPGGGCAAMDIGSGTFTAQTGGLYTVTFSGQADLYTGSILILHLLHNGAQLDGSVSYSKCGSATEHIEEMFSRTVVSTYM